MGFLDRLEARNSANTISSPAQLEELLRMGANMTQVGRMVTAQTALTSSPVWAAVMLLAGSVSQIPLNLYIREGENKRKLKPSEHHAARAIANPGPQSSVAWRQYMQASRGANGKSYAYINRVNGGQIRELIALPAQQVSKQKRDLSYVYRVDTASPVTGEFGRDEILEINWIDHIRHDGLIEGVGPVQILRESIGASIEAERHKALMLGNRAQPSGILTGKARNKEVVDNVREAWNQNMGGNGQYGVAVLDESWKFSPISMSAADIQLIEQMKFGVEEAARMFGVPSVMLASTDQAIRANVEQQSLNYVMHSLLPHLRTWEGALNQQLLTEVERDKYFFEFNVDGLLRGDFKSRMEGYSLAIASRIMNPNEARSRENLNRYDEGDAYANPNIEPVTPRT